MKIIAYLRVSGDKQTKSGLGIDGQLKECQDYAERQQMQLHSVYKDEGYSGKIGYEKRPGLLNAIAAVKKGDILLVQKLDRLARDADIFTDVTRLLIKKGARLVSANGEGTEDTSPTGRAMQSIVITFAQLEREYISARKKASILQQKLRFEKVGRFLPYGYQLHSDGKHIEKNPEEQMIISLIETLHGIWPSKKIAQELNRIGLLNRGILWQRQTIETKRKRYEYEASRAA